MMFFRVLAGVWFIVMQVLIIACVVRCWYMGQSQMPFKLFISVFVADIAKSIVWPLLIFTQRGRRQLKLLFSFK